MNKKNLGSYVNDDNSESTHWLLRYTTIAFVIFIPVVTSPGLWWLSNSIAVNPETSLSIIIRACCVIAASLLLVKFRILKRDAVMPLLFLGIFWSFYPALDYWLYGS